jgi:hypothetical protein
MCIHSNGDFQYTYIKTTVFCLYFTIIVMNTLSYNRCIILLCLFFSLGQIGHVAAYQCRCLIPVYSDTSNRAYIDCCRTMDINGDGRMDLFISCQLAAGDFHFGEVINMGTDFCLRRGSTGIGDICSGLRTC